MITRIIVVAMLLLVFGACGQEAAVNRPDDPMAPSLDADKAAMLPWRAAYMWSVTEVVWAGMPGQDTSTFDGRCSEPSDYIIRARFEGQAAHFGRVTGETCHCTQIAWSPAGEPMGMTYDDGVTSMRAANGSAIEITYGNGVTGYDPDTGQHWFEDEFTFVQGTGLFEGIAGGGFEGGSFADLQAVLAGDPVPMWGEGAVSFDPRP
ncbi:MAG: hypothetical protein R6X25_00715 [Candidatus Krumholzibacteriia bacterium]